MRWRIARWWVSVLSAVFMDSPCLLSSVTLEDHKVTPERRTRTSAWEDLSRIEDVIRVEERFDLLHRGHDIVRKLHTEVRRLGKADAMFPGHGPTQADCFGEDLLYRFLGLLPVFAGILNHEVDVEISVSRMAETENGYAEFLPHRFKGAYKGGDGGTWHHDIFSNLHRGDLVERLGKDPSRLPEPIRLGRVLGEVAPDGVVVFDDRLYPFGLGEDRFLAPVYLDEKKASDARR